MKGCKGWGASAGLLLACAQDPSIPSPDGPHYMASLEAEDSETAENACLEIQQTVLQSECLLHVAGDTARSGGEAARVCAQIQNQNWRQACYFEVSDAAGLIEEDAIKACAQAPDFAERCLSHAIVRHAGRVANRFKIGQELAFIDWIEAQAQRYGLASAERVISDVLAQHISSRACTGQVENQPCPAFSLKDCGAAPMEVCRQAYRVTARSAARHIDISDLCAQPIRSQSVSGAGLPIWKTDFTRPAIETWGHICQSMAGKTPPPSPELLFVPEPSTESRPP